MPSDHKKTKSQRPRKSSEATAGLVEESAGDSPVRIAKYMARAGLCSRREAERWIEDGRVKLNGKNADHTGYYRYIQRRY